MIIQQMVNGLVIGSIYALFGVGYTLIFGVLDLLNLAHGSIFMAGAIMAWVLVTLLHVNFFIAMLLAFVGAGLIGIILDQVSFSPFRRGRMTESYKLAPIISTIGFSTVLQSVAVGIYGPDYLRFPREAVTVAPIKIGSIMITTSQVAILLLALALVVGLSFLINRTRLGRAIRAVAENTTVAQLLGIPISYITGASFFISSGLGGVAGVLIGLTYNNINPYMGELLQLKGMAVIVLGGLGSIPGAAIAGFVLGEVEVFTVHFFSSGIQNAIAFGILFLTLVIKPSGFFKQESGERT